MYTELILLLIILIVIVYLMSLLRKQNTKKILIKKKVRFGIPTQVDAIKPIFKPRVLKKKSNGLFRFNPFNNIETYENYAIQ